ncbi:MAG: PLP-dependent aminotransferase family protein [Solirubrobacteraceae bacterium]
MSVLPEAGVISFARGVPAPEMLPVQELAECSRRAVIRHGHTALNYGAPGGFSPLREWIARGHGVDASRVLVTPGSLVAMNLLVRHLLPVRRRVIVEAPTYDRMLHLLAGTGAEIVTIANTEAGIELDRLRELLAAGPAPAFLYLLPTFHNPTGRTVGHAQRERLTELALEYELVVVEDDPYGLLRLDGRPLPSVHGLLGDRGGHELGVFMSSFSKTVAPGLRVGYAVLPESMVAPLQALATALYISPPLLAQAQLFEFLDAGLLDLHVERLTALLRPRRDALLDGLGDALPDGARLTRPDGGYFAWLDLPAPFEASRLEELGRAAGVTFVPGAAFFPAAGGERSARLSFSYPSAEEIRAGAERLAALFAR